MSDNGTGLLTLDEARQVNRIGTKRIAIVGKAPSSRLLAPFQDDTWEVWGLADLYNVIPRWDRWFELHEVDSRIEKWTACGYWDWLRKEHRTVGGDLKPIYVREARGEIPCGTVFPKGAIVERYSPTVSIGPEGRRSIPYFTNQVSWMIALAMHEGATDIGLWGVDMAQHGDGVKSEYAYQRPSCEYMLGLAAGMGIRTYVHERSDLLKARLLYGFDSDTNAMRLKWRARLEELQRELGEVSTNLQQQGHRQGVLQGHIDELTHWPEGEFRTERDAKWKGEMQKVVQALDMLVKRQHVLLGAIDDMQYWREWCD